jgi:hypothetical protein
MQLLFALLLLLTTLNTYTAHLEGLLIKGGLIFEKVQEAPLNQDYVIFTRQLDMTSLEPLKGMLKGALDTYDQVCYKATQNTGPLNNNEYQFTPIIEDSISLPYEELSTSYLFTVTRRGLIKNSAYYCQRVGARLLEIRNRNDLLKINSYCRSAETDDILSNIKYDSTLEKFYFGSTLGGMETSFYSVLTVRLHNGTEFQSNWSAHKLTSKDLDITVKKPIIYTNCKNLIAPFAKDLKQEYGPIHCEVEKSQLSQENYDDFQKSIFAWTKHNCKRDQNMISQQVHQAIREVEEITDSGRLQDSNMLLKYSDFIPIITTETFKPSDLSVNIFQNDQPIEETSNNMSSRELDIFYQVYNTTPTNMLQEIQLTLNISEVFEKDLQKFVSNGGLYKFSSNPPTFNRIKRVLVMPHLGLSYSMEQLYKFLMPFKFIFKAIMDQKKQPSMPTLDQFKTLSHEVNSINLNQKALKQAIELTQIEVEKYNSSRVKDFDAITAMAAEMSIKGVITFSLQTLKQIMMKIANILLAAMSEKTSVYALNHEELQMIVTAYTGKNPTVILSRDLAEVRTSLMGRQNEVKIKFKIPIIKQDQIFEFYHVIPIPIFFNNTEGTYTPDIDIEHLAITKKGQYYTTVANHELYKCFNKPPECTTHTAWKQAATAADCVMKTYMKDAPNCPLKKTSNDSSPFIYFNGVRAIYSVPRETSAFVKCNESPKYNHGVSVVLREIGEVNFEPGCIIQIIGEKQALYNTPSDAQTINVDGWPTFTTHIITQNLSAMKPPALHLTGFPDIEFKDIAIPTVRDIIRGAFHPSQSLSIALQIIAWITGFVLIGLIALCCYKTKCYVCIWSEMNKIQLRMPGRRRYEKRLIEEQRRQEAKKQFQRSKAQILE